jgi:uncharacterized protein YjbI with pentapeptide repeats
MKIIKPLTLCTLQKPYQLAGRNYFVVSALGFFRLGAVNERFLSESLQWPFVIPSLPKGQPLDEVMPKQQAEAIVLGNAHAPGGQPCTELTVRLCMTDAAGAASIDKCLRITGDREWRGGLSGSWQLPGLGQLSKAKPFSSIPLDCQHAFGGPGHPANPEGRGYDSQRLAAILGRRYGAMPNIEYANQTSSTPWQRSAPAGFGPLNVGWEPRSKKFGTYNSVWREQDAPGFARDIDWSVFNQAPSDQRAKSHFRGGETYCLHNLHPKKALIEGKLPQFQARAFILKNDQTAATAPAEIAMTMDTVWFLPEHDLGIVIYHGQTDIADSDALDVAALMVAYEDSNAPKSVEHYRQVMALRLDPATAALHVFNESQLAANRSPQEQAHRAAAQQQAETIDIAKRQEQLDLMDAQFWADYGSAPPPGYVGPVAKATPFGLVTAELVTEGDFDLAKTIEDAKAMAADAEQQGRAGMEQLAQQEVPQTPAVTPAQMLAAAIERGAIPAYDLLPPDETGCDPETAKLLAALDDALAKGGLDDPQQQISYAQAKQAILQTPALRRQARRASPTATPSDLPLLPEVALQLGQQARQWWQSGICLAGRDLAGANLAGLDFSGADLRQVMLEDADLSGAKLSGANLQGAVLTGAKLDQADFAAANLCEANLSASHGRQINFQNANLSRAQALSASWPQANLQSANLDDMLAVKLDLCGAVLNDASANRALLLEAKADDSQWLRATLTQTVLLRASLRRADFGAARLTKTVLIEAQMQDSRWQQAKWTGVQGTGGNTDWSRAALQGVQARECGMHSAVLAGADLRGAQFLRCDFGQSNMQGAKLDDGVFSHSLFLQTNLRCASARHADFYRALCRKTDFCGSDLSGASFAQSELTDAIGTDGKTDRQRRTA